MAILENALFQGLEELVPRFGTRYAGSACFPMVGKIVFALFRVFSGLFIEFMLQVIWESLRNDQVTDQVTDQVGRLLAAVKDRPATAAELMESLGLSHRPTLRKNYLHPALEAGLVEMTQPDSPRSPTQKYRLTAKGRMLLEDQ